MSFLSAMDKQLVFVFAFCFAGSVVAESPSGCLFIPDTVYGPTNASYTYTIGGMFSIHQHRRHPTTARYFCTLDDEKSAFNASKHRFGVEQTEAMALAIDQINLDPNLLGSTTLRFAIRDTCGLLVLNCPEDLAEALVEQDDVTATVVGPFYQDDGLLQDASKFERIFEQLSQISAIPGEQEGRGVFPVLGMPELPDTKSIDYTETVRYVNHPCTLQARAAVEFLVKAGWQNIAVITSQDNCGRNISKEFQDIIREHHSCNFKVQYFEEGRTSGSSPDGGVYVTPTFLSSFSTYTVFQELSQKDIDIIIVFSSIPFAYKLFGSPGYYNSFYIKPEQRRNFVFLLGDFWGEPGEADDLYNLVTRMVEDSRQVVSLRTHSNGYDKFQQHMANLTSSSRELQRNEFLRQFWMEYFNCQVGVDCTDSLQLPPIIRPILRNTDALLVIDAVYAAAGYIQLHKTLFPNNSRIVFSEMNLRKLNVTSWTGNVFQLDKLYPRSYIQVVEWKYDILILKAAGGENTTSHLEAEVYGQWTMHKDEPDKLSIEDNVSVQLWTPQSIISLCPTTDTPTSPDTSISPVTPTSTISLGTNAPLISVDRDCSPDDLHAMVALPVIILLLLIVMTFFYGMMEGWISVWKNISKLGNIILLVVTLIAVVVAILIATDRISAFSCNPLVADFLVNVIGCVCYAVILVAVLAQSIGEKLKYIRVKAVIFSLLVIAQVILSSVASFVTVDGKSGNETDGKHCLHARDSAPVIVSYWYNAVVALLSAFIFFVKFKRVRSQRRSPPSYAAPVMGLFLAVLFIVFVCILIWTEECLVQARLLVVLALYPAIVAACMVSKSALSQCFKVARKRRRSVQLPEQLEVGSPIRREPSHHYVTSSHVDSQVFVIPVDFWDMDIVKEITEVLVEPHRVQVQARIGKGNFGEVFKGTLDGRLVAVKSIQDRMNQNEVNGFVREGLQMKSFKHSNVMELLGICWSSDPAHARHVSPLIVLPYMELGDLKTHLRKCRPGRRPSIMSTNPSESETSTAPSSISTLQLIKFAHQIARGMEYISNKGIVHRDLATRNCMVNWDLEIKVADFGLARTMKEGKDYYRMGQSGQLPVRWMAIESLLDFVFTTKSDVWSYGVTLWEVTTLAQLPYPGVSNQEVIPILKRGQRLQRPDECPQEIFDIMMRCWCMDPEDRLDFSEIVEELEVYLAELVNYFDPSNPNQHEDPYVHWKLCRDIPEGVDEDDPQQQSNPQNKGTDAAAEIVARNAQSTQSLDRQTKFGSGSPESKGTGSAAQLALSVLSASFTETSIV